MRPSKGDILDGTVVECCRGGYLLLPFTCRPRIVKDFSDAAFWILWLFASLKKTCSILLSPPATVPQKNVPLALPSAL